MALARVEDALRAADERPGMDVGSSWILRERAAAFADGFPFERFALETETAAYASTTGPKTALFILVDFPDQTGLPATPSVLEQIVDTEVSDALDAYSYRQTSMDATVTPVAYRVESTQATYLGSKDEDDLYDEALTVYKNAGNPDPIYDTVAVLFWNTGFSWAGLATVGGQRMWLDGSTSAEVILHEFGHNYGLKHANYWVFDDSNAASTDPVDPTGANEEYGDDYDVMGDGNVEDGHFHPAAKQYLGWIGSGDWEDLSGPGDNGTYRVFRFDDADASDTRGLRISKSASSDYYWVGYRRDYGELEAFAKGAYLMWERAAGTPWRNQSWLIDSTPGSAQGKADAPVTLGQTYSDAASDVHITTLATGGTGPGEYLDVVVNFGPFPGNVAPAGSVVGDSVVDARQLVLFNAEATDANGDPLAYAWDMGDGELKSNAASVAHQWIQGGTYDVGINEDDGEAAIDLVSSDGKNWTVVDPGAVSERKAITSFAGSFISVGVGGSIRQSGVVQLSDSFETFVDTHFPGGGPDAAIDANIDGDWARNLEEYGLGGIPTLGGDSPVRPVVYLNGSGEPVFRVLRDAKRSDLAYSVWWSTDLASWTRLGLTTLTDSETMLEVVADGQDLSGGAGFFQLELTR